MKSFHKLFITFTALLILLCLAFNIILYRWTDNKASKAYLVEINRLSHELEQKNVSQISLANYTYITNVEAYNDEADFYQPTDSAYCIREIKHILYRFDYNTFPKEIRTNTIILFNCMIGIMILGIIIILFWVRIKILSPFDKLRGIPCELAKGNLVAPVRETSNHFFGDFIWGINMLREHIEEQKEKELRLQRDKKRLILSISHDIKTPLLAIKLYAKALSKRLYTDTEKQIEIAEHINEKTDEIEGFVSQIVKASHEDFLNLEVIQEEFYLSELIENISVFYREKLDYLKTEFTIENYSNCLLKGDCNRTVEVLQNIIENAIKYGNGHEIRLRFSEEEDCQLITVQNSGCTLPEAELPHIFESFWRGSNVKKKAGSGLGLYICRQLMHQMNGEIFAEIVEENMCITIVIPRNFIS